MIRQQNGGRSYCDAAAAIAALEAAAPDFAARRPEAAAPDVLMAGAKQAAAADAAGMEVDDVAAARIALRNACALVRLTLGAAAARLIARLELPRPPAACAAARVWR